MTTPVQNPQSSVINAGSSVSVTMTAIGTGSLVVLCPVSCSGGGITWAVSDNKSNAYVQRVYSGILSFDNTLIFDCLLPVSGVTTITLTPTGGTVNGSITAVEWPSALSFDQKGSTVQASPANGPVVATCTAPDSAANDVVFACMQEQGSGIGDDPTDPPSGWLHLSVTTNGNINANQCSYRVNSSVLTDSASWTWTNGATGASAGVASYTPFFTNTASIAWVS